jgi:pimeloyl-ACP methyl ester carboxylesterase
MTAASSSRVFVSNDASIEAFVGGNGPLVVLIPSLGRSARDFDDLAQRLEFAGYTAVRPEPRGIGLSRGPMTGLSLQDLAGDVALVIESLGLGPAVVIGHAFGQRVARMMASMRPDLTRGIVMIAAGGKIPIPEPARQALSGCFDTSLSDEQRLKHIQHAFFAPGNDPAVWKSGWFPEVARMQRATTTGLERPSTGGPVAETTATSVDAWWSGGSAPILVIQGLQDVIALPENGRLLKAEAGERVELIDIDGAGHALLPEQPALISEHVIAFLDRLDSGR